MYEAQTTKGDDNMKKFLEMLWAGLEMDGKQL